LGGRLLAALDPRARLAADNREGRGRRAGSCRVQTSTARGGPAAL